MTLDDGEQSGIVGGVGGRRPGRQAAEKTVAALKHRENQRLRLLLRESALDVARGQSGRPQQRYEKTRPVERIARLAPQRAARAPQRARVGFVADLVAQKREYLLRIVVQRIRFVDDIGVGGVVRPLELKRAQRFPDVLDGCFARM